MRRRGSVLQLSLDAAEVAVLRDLVGQVRDRLADEPPAGVPRDPVRARLLPEAHREDPKIAAAHRDLTEDWLIAAKRADADHVLEALPASHGIVPLPDPDPWLRALNDVRLSLGVELGITETSEPPAEVRTDRDLRLSVYYWLTYVQEILVDSLPR